MRIVDLETKSLNVPRPSSTNSRRLESRIEELTNQLNQTSKDSSRLHRSADKTARDAKFQLAEAERQRQRMEEEVRTYEGKISSMRQAMDELVSATDHPFYVRPLMSPANAANLREQPPVGQTSCRTGEC